MTMINDIKISYATSNMCLNMDGEMGECRLKLEQEGRGEGLDPF